MPPLLAALFVGASFVSSLSANKSQAKIQAAGIKMQTEQARLQASEAAYQRTREFRKNISANLALSGLGVGGLSGFRGAFSESSSDYLGDIRALEQGAAFAGLQGESQKALTKATRFSQDASALFNAASLAQDLGLFKAKIPTKTLKGKLK